MVPPLHEALVLGGRSAGGCWDVPLLLRLQGMLEGGAQCPALPRGWTEQLSGALRQLSAVLERSSGSVQLGEKPGSVIDRKLIRSPEA